MVTLWTASEYVAFRQYSLSPSTSFQCLFFLNMVIRSMLQRFSSTTNDIHILENLEYALLEGGFIMRKSSFS